MMYNPQTPEMLVGARIKVEWQVYSRTGSSFYDADILKYDAHTGRFFTRYLDDEKKNYKIFVTKNGRLRSWNPTRARPQGDKNDPHNITVIRWGKDVVVPPNIAMERTFPMRVILGQTMQEEEGEGGYFKCLFDLLGAEDAAVAAKSWSIVHGSQMQLHPARADALKQCGQDRGLGEGRGKGRDWSAIIGSKDSSPLQLLYSLRIIQRLLDADDSPSADAPPSYGQAWASRFLSSGGLSHLVLLFCEGFTKPLPRYRQA